MWECACQERDLAARRRGRRRVHRSGPRPLGPAGRRAPGRRGGLEPRALGRGGRPPRRGAGVRLRPRARDGCGRRCRPHLHAQPPAPPARGGRAGGRQARHLREAARAGRGGCAAAGGAGSPGGPPGGRPVRLPLLPDRARGPRARALRVDRAAAAPARHLPAGLALERCRRQLAGGRGARRRLARVRRHRLALVRPGRVRLRPPHRPALRPHRDRRAAARPRRLARGVRARGGRGRAARRDHRGRRGRPVRDRRRRARLGRGQPDLPRPQEPPVAGGRRGGGGADVLPRAARISDAVLASDREGAWVDVRR